MKKVLIMLILLVAVSFASMTKIYIGNENDQVIIGIETIAANVDAGVGLDLRTFFRKNGIMVNGVEYGSVPGKTQYNFMLAGKTEDGTIAKFHRIWAYNIDESTNQMFVTAQTSLGIGYGKGGYLLYH